MTMISAFNNSIAKPWIDKFLSKTMESWYCIQLLDHF